MLEPDSRCGVSTDVLLYGLCASSLTRIGTHYASKAYWSFQYEEEKSTTGMTALSGLMTYVELSRT